MLLDRAGQEEGTGLILQCEQGSEYSILYLLCRLRPIYVALYGTGRARFSSYHIRGQLAGAEGDIYNLVGRLGITCREIMTVE